MSHSTLGVGKAIQSYYNEQYTDEMTAWREIGGKYKARNILKVCQNYKYDKVLDCGAGEGSILKHLDESDVFSDLFAIEISDLGVAQISKRNLRHLKEVKKFNGYNIPYVDKEFDMSYCSHVIEHVEHPRLLLRELKRISNFQVFEIPLDYSTVVDKKIKHFLSYGHINIYTPSLFKFLLKSEGYEILEELLTHAADETIRFNWYTNMKLEKSSYRELTLKLAPLCNFLKRKVYNKDYYNEHGYFAYTCLARGIDGLKIG